MFVADAMHQPDGRLVAAPLGAGPDDGKIRIVSSEDAYLACGLDKRMHGSFLSKEVIEHWISSDGERGVFIGYSSAINQSCARRCALAIAMLDVITEVVQVGGPLPFRTWRLSLEGEPVNRLAELELTALQGAPGQLDTKQCRLATLVMSHGLTANADGLTIDIANQSQLEAVVRAAAQQLREETQTTAGCKASVDTFRAWLLAHG